MSKTGIDFKNDAIYNQLVTRFCNFNGKQAVSYTHLDVYKRQGCYGLWDFVGRPEQERAVHGPWGEGGRGEKRSDRQLPHQRVQRLGRASGQFHWGDGAGQHAVRQFIRCGRDQRPVSYTHLLSSSRHGLYIDGWDLFIYDNWLTANRECGAFGEFYCNTAIICQGNRVEWNGREGILSNGGVTWVLNGNHFDRNGREGARFYHAKHIDICLLYTSRCV